MSYTIQSALATLGKEAYRLEGNRSVIFTNAATLSNANKESIVWIKPGVNLAEFNAAVIVCNNYTYESIEKSNKSAFLVVSEPKRIFSIIVNELLVQKLKPGIHPTAYVHPEAIIGEDCYIGPFTYIGKAEIGSKTVVHGHCHIYDGIRIGRNSIIHAGVVLGSDGFGYSKNEDGTVEKFPHIGSVVIGDNVEIGANTCVDRGALGDTVIHSGAKIDNLVHVAHNVVVGEGAFLIANAMIGGSTHIGNGVWIAPSASLLQQLTIGANATIGVGAVVTKNVPANETWTGSPARPLQEFLAMQKKIKNL